MSHAEDSHPVEFKRRFQFPTRYRVLARLPYGRGLTDKPVDEFNYDEGVDGTDHEKYAWMNSAWAFGARITNAFAKDGWFMRSRGVEGGGQVEGLPLHVFNEAGGKTAKCPTEVLIPDRREAELSGLGFLPLLHYKDSDKAVFIGTQTSQKPKKYFDNAANANAELSTKLNYMLCVSRFAHYLKAMARDKLGSFAERGEMDDGLFGRHREGEIGHDSSVKRGSLDKMQGECPNEMPNQGAV